MTSVQDSSYKGIWTGRSRAGAPNISGHMGRTASWRSLVMLWLAKLCCFWVLHAPQQSERSCQSWGENYWGAVLEITPMLTAQVWFCSLFSLSERCPKAYYAQNLSPHQPKPPGRLQRMRSCSVLVTSDLRGKAGLAAGPSPHGWHEVCGTCSLQTKQIYLHYLLKETL